MPAPVIFFAYNRPSHTLKTISALQANEFASQSDLFVYCDGPKADATEKELTAIHDTREVFKAKLTFKSVTIYESDTNKGLFNSLTSGITTIINKFGKAIIVEDDILTSPYFLSYCNKALDYYENEEKVMAISGYKFPIKGNTPSNFFLTSGGVWGWATWKRAWNKFNPNAGMLLTEIENRNLKFSFNFDNSYDYFQMLTDQKQNKLSSWDICWYASIFISEGVTIYPSKTFVQNIGMDGSGTHYNKNSAKEYHNAKLFSNENEYKNIVANFPADIYVYKNIYIEHCKYFSGLVRNSLLSKLKVKTNNLFGIFKPHTN